MILNLETSIDRPWFRAMYYKLTAYRISTLHLLGESAYAFDCTFFRPLCLTANALRRMTMHGFLVGANRPEKCTLKRVQLRFLGLSKYDR